MKRDEALRVLGLPESASAEEVKKRYRKLAHEFHPDKSPSTQEQFKQLNEANRVLNGAQMNSQFNYRQAEEWFDAYVRDTMRESKNLFDESNVQFYNVTRMVVGFVVITLFNLFVMDNI